MSQPAKIAGGSIITAKHSKKRRYDRTGDLPDDPAVDEQVRQFFARMGLSWTPKQK